MTKRLVLFATLVLTGCPTESTISPREACDDEAAAYCERIYACYRSDELTTAGYPALESACVTMFQQALGCAAQTLENACTGNATFHGDEAMRCSEQIIGLECSQVRDPFLSIETAAPACGKVCAID